MTVSSAISAHLRQLLQHVAEQAHWSAAALAEQEPRIDEQPDERDAARQTLRNAPYPALAKMVDED